jgi:hypothetical protein
MDSFHFITMNRRKIFFFLFFWKLSFFHCCNICKIVLSCNQKVYGFLPLYEEQSLLLRPKEKKIQRNCSKCKRLYKTSDVNAVNLFKDPFYLFARLNTKWLRKIKLLFNFWRRKSNNGYAKITKKSVVSKLSQ